MYFAVEDTNLENVDILLDLLKLYKKRGELTKLKDIVTCKKVEKMVGITNSNMVGIKRSLTQSNNPQENSIQTNKKRVQK